MLSIRVSLGNVKVEVSEMSNDHIIPDEQPQLAPQGIITSIARHNHTVL